MTKNNNDIQQYSHNITTKKILDTKKCTLCNKPELIRLPDDFQNYAARKGFESFYCSNCLQVVNFCLLSSS